MRHDVFPNFLMSIVAVANQVSHQISADLALRVAIKLLHCERKSDYLKLKTLFIYDMTNSMAVTYILLCGPP